MRRLVTATFAALLVAGLVPVAAGTSAAFSTAGSASAASADTSRSGSKYKVLVLVSPAYSKAEKNGVQQLRQLGLDRGFTLEVTGDTSVVTATNLAKYRAVAFLNTTGDYLNDAQQAAFEGYFGAGGGFVGIGSAVELEPSWAFLTDVLGSRSTAKLDAQTVTNKVADRVHDASKNLPEYWNLNDTYYNWTSNVRGLSHVLTTVSDAPFTKTGSGPTINALTGGTMGADHPVTWCKDYKGGRSYYTNHGAAASAWSDANLVKELLGALTWASGQSDPAYSDCGATVLANYSQVKISSPPNVSEPIGFDQLPDGRVIQTDRRGGVRLHNPASGTTNILANIPVYTNSEDGLYGPGIDNNFASNHWVYLYYAPPVVTDITYSDGTTGHTNDFTAAPFLNGAAPTQATDISAWDAWIGYFQLSRFTFVDDAPGAPAHLDLASEQQILRVANNRGACCHVGGDIDFDKNNNLWFVTGDDSAAGSGDAGAWGQSIDQKTDENQTVRVSASTTGGTFTLTFNGQTTPPLAFNATAAQISAALGALSTIGSANIQATGGPVNTANVLATWKGTFEEQDVSSLTADATGLTGSTPTVTIGVGTGAAGSNTTARQGGLWRMPAADSGRSAMNTNDLRGKINRIKVKATDIATGEANKLDLGTGGAYTVPAGNLFPLAGGAPQPKTRPEVYAMGFRNPFRIQVDSDDVAYISDYSPDSQTPQQFHGTPGTGRFEIVRKPANYGWPYCFKPDLPEYPWNVNLQVPMNLTDHQPVPAGVTPQPYDCGNSAGVPNND
ncbi:MAG: cytochrome c, partial [Pseudonocardiales bacterium]|nr:cytochrome c [Pseudonocardiales bacterium]